MERQLSHKGPPEHGDPTNGPPTTESPSPSTPTPPRLTPNPLLLDSPVPTLTPATSSPPPPLTPAPAIITAAAAHGLKGSAATTPTVHNLVPAPPKLTPTVGPALRTYSRPLLPSATKLTPASSPSSLATLSSSSTGPTKSSTSQTNGRPTSSSTPITPFHTPASPPSRQVSHGPPTGSPSHSRTNQSSNPARQKVPQQTLLLGKSLRGPGHDQVLLRAQMLILTSAMRPALSSSSSSSSSSGPASAQLQSLTLRSPLSPSMRLRAPPASSLPPPLSRPQASLFPPLRPRPQPGSTAAERPLTPTRHLSVPPPMLYSPVRAIPLRPRLHPPRSSPPRHPSTLQPITPAGLALSTSHAPSSSHAPPSTCRPPKAPSFPHAVQGALLSASSSAARQLQIIALSSGHAHSVIGSPDPTGQSQMKVFEDPPPPAGPATTNNNSSATLLPNSQTPQTVDLRTPEGAQRWKSKEGAQNQRQREPEKKTDLKEEEEEMDVTEAGERGDLQMETRPPQNQKLEPNQIFLKTSSSRPSPEQVHSPSPVPAQVLSPVPSGSTTHDSNPAAIQDTVPSSQVQAHNTVLSPARVPVRNPAPAPPRVSVQSPVPAPSQPRVQNTTQTELPILTSVLASVTVPTQVHTLSPLVPDPAVIPAVIPATDPALVLSLQTQTVPEPSVDLHTLEDLSDNQSALSSLSSQSPPSSPFIPPPLDPPPLNVADVVQSQPSDTEPSSSLSQLRPVAEFLDQSEDENQNHDLSWRPGSWPVGREVLTHLVEGFVIQEGLQPFPVNRSSLLLPDQVNTPVRENGTNGKAPSPDPKNSAEHTTDSDKGVGASEPTAKSGQRDRAVLHCQFCGKRGHAHNFMRSKRFCSTSCARGFNVRLTKRLRALSAGSRSERPRPLLNRAESVPGKPLLLRLPRDLWSAGRREKEVNEVKEVKETVAEEEEDEEEEEEDNNEDNDIRDETFTVTTRAEPRHRRMSAPALTTSTPTSTFKPPPSQWSVEEVTGFIHTLPGCGDVAEAFRLQEIDGQALLLLTEDHLMTSMNIKLGPALKICAHINALKNP